MPNSKVGDFYSCMKKNGIIYDHLKNAVWFVIRRSDLDTTKAIEELEKALTEWPLMMKECFPMNEVQLYNLK